MIHFMKWAAVLCALWACTACGAKVTELDGASGAVHVTEQALQIHNKWFKHEKSKHAYRCSPWARHGHRPPDHRDKKQCERLGYECGRQKISQHGYGHGNWIDCGACGEGGECELGACVMECDPDETTVMVCAANGSVETRDSCGTVVASSPCDFGCTDGVCDLAICGDGIVNMVDEQCDDGNDVNEDACTNACTLPACGDGITHPSEECDDGNDVDNDVCDNDCHSNTCGDGAVNIDEECDDGNDVNEDDCSNNCTAAACGDNIVQLDEQCDDGNVVDTDACTAECFVALCGDGIAQAGVEQCDDGNEVNDDSCSNVCTAAVCGDGIVQTDELCDDGNEVDSDLCTSACQVARCGDHIVQPDNNEACDDGPLNDIFGPCSLSCQSIGCGDGVVQSGELCDDGNDDDTDTCTSECQPARCGDEVVQVGEECDDGPLNGPLADCSLTCKITGCGDGELQTLFGEECDDGNTTAGDGCNDTCEKERLKVFVTSELYTGDLGGLEGADAKCQALAETAELPGTYLAWLAVNGVASPTTRFATWTGGYELVNGTPVADSWQNIAFGLLDAPIDKDEKGNFALLATGATTGANACPVDTVAWSGTNAVANWQIVTYCSGWTAATGEGHAGNYKSVDGSWKQYCFPGCEDQLPIRCFQQPEPPPPPEPEPAP